MNERAYITVLSDNSFINGVVVLHATLMATGTRYPLYAVVTPEVSEENLHVLEQLGIDIIKKDILLPPKQKSSDAPDEVKSLDVYGWHKALVKLHIFGLTEFEKLIYLDADLVIKQNIDYLFHYPHMSACVDVQRFERLEPETRSFCSGLLVIEPDEFEYKKLLNFFNNFDGQGKLVHDQWVLQEFYKDWNKNPFRVLDEWTCPWTTYFEGNASKYYLEFGKVKTLHIIDKKPWRAGKQYFKDCSVNWPLYSKLCLDYIDILNFVINDLYLKGIKSSDLRVIQ